MGQTVRFREVLRRLAVVDESFAKDMTGLASGDPRPGEPVTRVLQPSIMILGVSGPGAGRG